MIEAKEGRFSNCDVFSFVVLCMRCFPCVLFGLLTLPDNAMNRLCFQRRISCFNTYVDHVEFASVPSVGYVQSFCLGSTIS